MARRERAWRRGTGARGGDPREIRDQGLCGWLRCQIAGCIACRDEGWRLVSRFREALEVETVARGGNGDVQRAGQAVGAGIEARNTDGGNAEAQRQATRCGDGNADASKIARTDADANGGKIAPC